MQNTKEKKVSLIRLFYAMLTNSGLQAFKDNIVFTFTAGRTVHVSELNCEELQKLCDIMRKKGFPVTQGETLEYRLRRKIYALCFDAGIIYGHTQEDWKMNFAKVDAFCMERGAVKKGIKEQNLNELKRTLKQFYAIATKVQKRQNRVLLIAKLESDLNEAIHAEDFELCASIREQINNIILNVKTKQEQ